MVLTIYTRYILKKFKNQSNYYTVSVSPSISKSASDSPNAEPVLLLSLSEEADLRTEDAAELLAAAMTESPPEGTFLRDLLLEAIGPKGTGGEVAAAGTTGSEWVTERAARSQRSSRGSL